MPLSTKLRFRRPRRATRRATSRSLGLSALAALLPRAVVLPIVLFAGVTAATAAYWTYDMHIEQAYGEIDDGLQTGTVDSAE